MQSILLLFNLSTFFIFGFNALEYSNRWTVQVDGDNDEADRLARKHGFVNHGKVSNLTSPYLRSRESGLTSGS